jgi:hypothetical protein
MKKISRLAITAAVLTALTVLFSKPVMAQEQNATNNSNVTVTCTSGNYGQSNNCYATTNQTINQNMNVLGATDRRGAGHTPVNTGMDTTTSVAAVITLMSTAAGAVVTLKSKIA